MTAHLWWRTPSPKRIVHAFTPIGRTACGREMLKEGPAGDGERRCQPCEESLRRLAAARRRAA